VARTPKIFTTSLGSACIVSRHGEYVKWQFLSNGRDDECSRSFGELAKMPSFLLVLQATICRCIGHSLHMLHWGYIQLKLPRVIHYTREPRSSLSTAEAPCGRLTRSIRKSSKCLQKYWRCRQCNSHRRRLDFMRFCQEVHDFRKAYSGHDARTLCVAERCCQRTARR
jgi:hypothetical protein